MRIEVRKGEAAKADRHNRNDKNKYSKVSKSIVSVWDNALVFCKHIGALMRHLSSRQSPHSFGASNEESENTCILI